MREEVEEEDEEEADEAEEQEEEDEEEEEEEEEEVEHEEEEDVSFAHTVWIGYRHPSAPHEFPDIPFVFCCCSPTDKDSDRLL